MNWQTKKLGDFVYVTDFVANGSFASLRENVKYLDTPNYAILVRLKDFTKGWNNNYVYVSRTSYEFLKKSSLIPGDLVMSNVGEPGKVFVVPDLEKPMTLGPNSILIRPNKSEMLTEFLNYYFRSPQGQNQIKSITSGTTQKKFNKTSFRILPIPATSLIDQKRIVEILDEVFEKIEQAKENTEKNLQNSRQIFESYLQSVFANPDGVWEKREITEVCELKSGTTISPSLERNEGNVLYTKIADMNLPENVVEINTSSRFVNSNEIKKNQIIPLGAVIFPKRGGAIATNKKRKIIKPTIVDLNTMAIIPSKKINKDYFFHWFQLIRLSDISNGTSVPQINNYSFSQVYISYPVSLKEQLNIVQKLDALSKETKKLEEIYKQKLSYLEELKKSILQKAFEGELVN